MPSFEGNLGSPYTQWHQITS